MKRVLILGNGISRVHYHNFISAWENEIWVCNRAYQEWSKWHNITRVSGHRECLEMALEYRVTHSADYDIYTYDGRTKNKLFKEMAVPKKEINNTGINWVIQAFMEKYEKIVLVGFDIGGHDIYVKNHWKFFRSNWIIAWRKLLKKYDHKKIMFIGYDHKPYLLGTEGASKYAKLYTKGQNHLV